MMLSTAIFNGNGVSNARGGANALSKSNTPKCGQYAATCRSKRQCNRRWSELFGPDIVGFLFGLHSPNRREERTCGRGALVENPDSQDRSDRSEDCADNQGPLHPGVN